MMFNQVASNQKICLIFSGHSIIIKNMCLKIYEILLKNMIWHFLCVHKLVSGKTKYVVYMYRNVCFNLFKWLEIIFFHGTSL